MMPRLVAENLTTGYGRRAAIEAVALSVGPGEIVSLIGHNGAGKSTTLRCIFGMLNAWTGDVLYDGESITGRSPSENVASGIAYMPQDRALFPALTIQENLEMAAHILRDYRRTRERIESVEALFPLLKERSHQIARTLSGGEQRMLSFGMALMVRPRLIMLDEPSLGLSPIFVRRLFEKVEEVRESMGVSFLIVEQNVKQALRVSERVYVMKMGRVVLHEEAAVLLKRGAWWDLF